MTPACTNFYFSPRPALLEFCSAVSCFYFFKTFLELPEYNNIFTKKKTIYLYLFEPKIDEVIDDPDTLYE